jgi:hypothetical protein
MIPSGCDLKSTSFSVEATTCRVEKQLSRSIYFAQKRSRSSSRAAQKMLYKFGMHQIIPPPKKHPGFLNGIIFCTRKESQREEGHPLPDPCAHHTP